MKLSLFNVAVDRVPAVFFNKGSLLIAECDVVADLVAVDCGMQEFKLVQKDVAAFSGTKLASFRTALICYKIKSNQD